MKIIGTIVTTIVEHVEVDLGDQQIPDGEIGELFMKVAMTITPKTVVSKHVQFNPLHKIID